LGFVDWGLKGLMKGVWFWFLCCVGDRWVVGGEFLEVGNVDEKRSEKIKW
jgi:hypothetical protein